MRAVDQWTALQAELGDTWERATLAFRVEDAGTFPDAAGVLGPLAPGRVGEELRFELLRRGSGRERLRNLLAVLDRKRIWGDLAIVSSYAEERSSPPVERRRARRPLAVAWDDEVARLPAGWRDLLCELELDSSDYVPRAALLGSPLNPSRKEGEIALRFRASRGGGYGAATVMVRRCLERMDVDGITGRVRVLTALSDTDDVATQGPVWRVAGRSV